MNPKLKTCTKCGESKSKDDFYSVGKGKGLVAECKPCRIKYVKGIYLKDPSKHLEVARKWVKNNQQKRRVSIEKYAPKSREKARIYRITHREYIRNFRFKRDYGITSEIYDRMFAEQEEKCLICKRHQSEFKKSFAVDHCHTTKKIRGLLCGSCNTALGSIKDNLITLKNMQKYLEKHA